MWLADRVRRLFARAVRPSRRLDDERTGHFFSWFALTPNGGPAPADRGYSWQEFRPSNPVYAKVVALAVLTDRDGHIIEARLGIDRSFLDHRQQSASARDIAKSFLLWAIADQDRAHVEPLIANIADVTAGGATVLMRDLPPSPPVDRSGGYDVFLGRASNVAVKAGASRLGLANFAGLFPAAGIHRDATPASRVPGWLRIDVRG